jgi:chemotaxis protein CheX
MDKTLKAGPARVQIHLSARAAGADSRPTEKVSGAAQPTSHDGWREELAQATREVFEIMLGTSLGSPNEGSPHFVADFAAMVGIAGSLCGLVGLHTSSECARRMAATMLGTEELGGSEDAQDAFGEVCNMIAGSFKGRIAGLADGCALSVPTVIFGRDFTLFSLAKGEHYQVTFSFEGKPFSVTLDLHN